MKVKLSEFKNAELMKLTFLIFLFHYFFEIYKPFDIYAIWIESNRDFIQCIGAIRIELQFYSIYLNGSILSIWMKYIRFIRVIWFIQVIQFIQIYVCKNRIIYAFLCNIHIKTHKFAYFCINDVCKL